MKSRKIEFPGASGAMLAARLDLPAEPRAFALFAHCFTCGKDIFAASRIAEGLASRDIAVLRFDFTGIGSSEGEFANTNFSSNVADLVAAADYLRQHHGPPSLLIGHSLGGAAVLAAAPHVADATAIVTIGAPASATHVTHNFAAKLEDIARNGTAEVTLAGRSFTITKPFLDDLAGQSFLDDLGNMKKALLVCRATNMSASRMPARSSLLPGIPKVFFRSIPRIICCANVPMASTSPTSSPPGLRGI
jgi:putative redox protein